MATEFNIVSFMTQTQYHLEKLYKNPEHFPFNRNANYMSFDPTRVTLGQEPDKDKV